MCILAAIRKEAPAADYKPDFMKHIEANEGKLAQESDKDPTAEGALGAAQASVPPHIVSCRRRVGSCWFGFAYHSSKPAGVYTVLPVHDLSGGLTVSSFPTCSALKHKGMSRDELKSRLQSAEADMVAEIKRLRERYKVGGSVGVCVCVCVPPPPVTVAFFAPFTTVCCLPSYDPADQPIKTAHVSSCVIAGGNVLWCTVKADTDRRGDRTEASTCCAGEWVGQWVGHTRWRCRWGCGPNQTSSSRGPVRRGRRTVIDT